MKWAAIGEKWARDALEIIRRRPTANSDDLIWDHYTALMDHITPDDPEGSPGWFKARSGAYLAYETVIRESGIPNTLFREDNKDA